MSADAKAAKPIGEFSGRKAGRDGRPGRLPRQQESGYMTGSSITIDGGVTL